MYILHINEDLQVYSFVELFGSVAHFLKPAKSISINI